MALLLDSGTVEELVTLIRECQTEASSEDCAQSMCFAQILKVNEVHDF